MRSIRALAGLAAACACVFHPPPPLPEELAAAEAERAARIAALRGGKSEGEGGKAQAGEEPRFRAGDEPELGMTPEEMKAYAVAQGDPLGGAFALEQALADLPAGGELWARLSTERGAIECRLHPEHAPLTVANFVGLARGVRPFRDAVTGEWVTRPYYDGTEFHRVIEGFMIQGGDPTATGRGGAGYVIPDEPTDALRHDAPGRLSMANRGPGTGSSQFFITLAPVPELDGKHTVFGSCTEPSVAIAEAIAQTGGAEDRPTTPQVVERVEIVRK
jgi:peptidyl-prolyl cis-trans isomerase A (cyclophilin A)